MPRSRLLVALIALVALALTSLAPGLSRPVLAADPTQTVTFGCVGFPQYFSVPPGVTQLGVHAEGAAGGDLSTAPSPGMGGMIDGTLSVTPGQLLEISAGCRTGYGWANGGNGGVGYYSGSPSGVGGSGGGGTGIASSGAAQPFLVAGGGGGGGAHGFFAGDPYAGGAGGSGGATPGNGSDGNGPGHGSGGSGAASASKDGTPGGDNTNGGTSGGGGGGGGYPTGGGGGSGGTFGGGGGGGGGGGRSYVDPSAVLSPVQGVAGAASDGTVILTYSGPDASSAVYTCTGSLASYTVPTGVTRLIVTAIGADGTELYYAFGGGNPGLGGGARGEVQVIAGEQLSVGAGCAGGLPSTGDTFDSTNPGGAGGFGYRSGGAGGAGDKPPLTLSAARGGGGGGGASGIGRGTATPLLIAAGGGGGGGSGNVIGCQGGNGGTADVGGGTEPASSCVNEGGGGGLGAAGAGSGNGGDGCSYCSSAGGGGGGGGYQNGGGGGGGGIGSGGGGGGGGGISLLAGPGVANGELISTGSYRPLATRPPNRNDINGIVSISPVFGKLDQTIAFGAPANKTVGDPDFNVSATASSGLPVSFAVGGSCTVAGATVHITGAGSCTITASQGGDSSYNPAPSVSQTFSIAKANQTIAFGALANKTYGDPDFAVGATASSGLPVSFAASGSCTITGTTVHITGAGSCTITASQGGDSSYNPAPSVSQTFSIAKANQMIAFGALANKTYGDPDFAVGATASSGLPVSFAAGGSCTVAGTTVHLTGAGSCTITASQGGNATYNPAPSVSQTFSIAKANQTITFGPLANKTFADPPFTVGATASSGLPVSFSATGNCTIAGNTLTLTGVGTCTITASQGGDSNYNPVPSVSQTFNIAKAPTTTTVSANPAAVQYSDQTTLSATVGPITANGATATGSVEFFINGVSVGIALIDGGGGATKAIVMTRAPGNYSVTAKFTSSAANFADSPSSAAFTLAVTPEDARVTYTGNSLFWTSSASSTSANVTLSATIQDITAVAGDPAYDANAGDIRNAKVTFINRDTGTAFTGCSNLPVGLVNAGDTKIGTAVCTTALALSGAGGATQYSVGIVVSGYYTRDDSYDNIVINVAQPLTSNCITGGGYLSMRSSAGQYPGTAGSKMNFGLNVRYGKGGKNPQGNVNIIVRSGGRIYQIKSNAITSLSVALPRANFSGKASIQDITKPRRPVTIDTNATLQIWMTDNGEPGTGDTIGIQVLNKSGGMWFSSNWSGTKTVEQTLGGGNLIIH